MSLGDSRIPEEKAEVEAEALLRHKIGNLPHLGDPSCRDGEYVFPVLISLPRVIFDKDGETPIEVRFLDEEHVGEIRVNSTSGEILSWTDASEIEEEIEDKEREIEHAVQKALIKSEADAFSLLPYSSHRITPVRDVLSEVILSECISESRLCEMGEDAYDRYDNHIDTLIDVGLIRREGDIFVAGDHLTEILSKDIEPSEVLNDALTYLFENKAEDLDMLHDILGPQLELAGYYYRRSIESEEMPRVTQAELRRQYVQKYSGQKARRRGFKVSRYLLQLEQIGLIETDTRHGDRVWKGKGDIRANLLEQRNELSPIAEIAPG